MLSIIEKVIFLQNVDVFTEVSTEQLSFLATIAEEVQLESGTQIYEADGPSDSMYLVVEGSVRLHRGDKEVTTAGPKEPFGTWALFDDKPRVVSATATADTTVLRIMKEDFIDLLADHVQITQGVMKAIVRRMNALVGRLGADLTAGPSKRAG